MSKIKHLFLCQIIISAVLTVTVDLLWGHPAARSTLFGGMLAVVPNIILSLYFKRMDPSSLKKMASALYIGEAVKIVSIAVLMVLALHFYRVQLGPLLIGLLGTYLAYLFVPLYLRGV